MNTSIVGKCAIVTGGAQGIGYMCVRNLLLEGAKMVAILDWKMKTGNKASEELNAEFGANRVIFLPTDVSKADQFNANFKTAIEKLGNLDIMINNAAIVNESDWSLMIDVNYKAIVQGTLMAIKVMGKHEGGRGGNIINIGSTAAFRCRQFIPIYCGTKSAIVQFSRVISMNFEKTGVAIKTICPGATNTTIAAPLIYSSDFSFFDSKAASSWHLDWKLQPPDTVAREIIKFIEEGSNGDIWSNEVETSTISLNIPDFITWGSAI